MKAKDTVMIFSKVYCVVNECEASRKSPDVNEWLDPYMEVAEKQAEITWKARDLEIAEAKKAGMREVVVMGNEACPHKHTTLDALDEGVLTKRECPQCWQTFIKENGLDQHEPQPEHSWSTMPKIDSKL